MISPHAVTLGLGTLALGSTGDTRAEILRALEFEGRDALTLLVALRDMELGLGGYDDLEGRYRSVEQSLLPRLMRNYHPFPGIREYASGVGVWVPPGFPVRERFQAVAATFSTGGVHASDLRIPSERAEALAKWFSEETNGRFVPRRVDLGHGAGLLIAAVAHWDGLWGLRHGLSTGEFRSSEHAVPAQFLEFRGVVENETADYEEARIEAGVDATVRFLKPKRPLEEWREPCAGPLVEPSLGVLEFGSDAASTGGSLARAASLIAARVPVFDTEFQLDLAPVLQDGGIRSAFDASHAELSCLGACGVRSLLRFGGSGNHVASLWHAARMRVHEPGINDARTGSRQLGFAREAVEGAPTAPPLIFDEPFVALVVEQDTGAVLYAAWIADVLGGGTEEP